MGAQSSLALPIRRKSSNEYVPRPGRIVLAGPRSRVLKGRPPMDKRSPDRTCVALAGRAADPRVAEAMQVLARHLVARGCAVKVAADERPALDGVEGVQTVPEAGAGTRVGPGRGRRRRRHDAARCPHRCHGRRPRARHQSWPPRVPGRRRAREDRARASTTRSPAAASPNAACCWPRRSKPTASRSTALALNDVVVAKRETGRMVDVRTWVNGAYVNTHVGDGFIIATPTGSTAYALSCGGPIVHPSLDAVVLVPICPHTLSDRPIVVPADSVIELELADRFESRAQVVCDGMVLCDLDPGVRLRIERASVQRHPAAPARPRLLPDPALQAALGPRHARGPAARRLSHCHADPPADPRLRDRRGRRTGIRRRLHRAHRRNRRGQVDPRRCAAARRGRALGQRRRPPRRRTRGGERDVRGERATRRARLARRSSRSSTKANASCAASSARMVAAAPISTARPCRCSRCARSANCSSTCTGSSNSSRWRGAAISAPPSTAAASSKQTCAAVRAAYDEWRALDEQRASFEQRLRDREAASTCCGITRRNSMRSTRRTARATRSPRSASASRAWAGSRKARHSWKRCSPATTAASPRRLPGRNSVLRQLVDARCSAATRSRPSRGSGDRGSRGARDAASLHGITRGRPRAAGMGRGAPCGARGGGPQASCRRARSCRHCASAWTPNCANWRPSAVERSRTAAAAGRGSRSATSTSPRD